MGTSYDGDDVPTCCVVGDRCMSPANCVPVQRCRTTCFACGQPVCTASSCSTRRRWYHYGRKRICQDCWEDHSKIRSTP